MRRRKVSISGVVTRPSAASIARPALIWYAMGQMPQMRATMSGTSWIDRPRKNASKKRGASKIASSAATTSPSFSLSVKAPSPSTRVIRSTR